MRKTMLVTLMPTMILFGACGRGADNGDSASETSATPTTAAAAANTASPTGEASQTSLPGPASDDDATSTTIAPDQYTDKQRDKVRSILKPFLNEYGEVVETIEPGATSMEDAKVDEQIAASCETKAKGFTATPDEIDFVTVLIGAQLEEMHKDVATFMEDSFDFNRKVAAVVGC